MIKTRTLYNNENKTANRLITSQFDVVNRSGVVDLGSEIKLMERAGNIYNNYVEKVYKDMIGKGEGQELKNGRGTMEFKETMDMIDEERSLTKRIKENREKIEKIKEEIKNDELELNNSLAKEKGNTQTDNKTN